MFSLLSPEIVWLLRQARPYFRIQIASVLCIMASSGLSLLDPLVMRWLLDRILPGRNVRGLLVALFLFLAIYLGRFLMSNWGGLLTLKASQKFVLDLRMRLLRHLDRLSADYHETHSAGASLYLFKEPIDEMSQLGADLLPSALRTGILTAFVLATMLFLNAHLTVAVLPFIPAYLFVTHGYRNRLRDESDLVQQKQESVSSFLQEHFATIVQLQLLSAEKRQQKAGFHFFAETIRAVCKLWKTSIKYSVTSNMITTLGMVTVLGVGGAEYFRGALTVGSLVAFYSYLNRLFDPLSGAVDLYSRLQRVGASVRKVMGGLELQPSVQEYPRPIHLPAEAKGAITFEKVTFSYNRSGTVLSDLSFDVPPGGKVALVGTNGCGKSTTGKLIARLYDPFSGVVRVDGVDIRKLALKNLRSLVCYLPQHAVLFDTHLRENLGFGSRETSEQKLERVIALCELDAFVTKLPGGLRGSLGPSGNKLSGGERQRVAIARGILQEPRILILDEATSFLDGKTEERILARLTEQYPATTIIVISHHLSALRWVDKIFVLRNGRIFARGTHAELSQENSFYVGLFRSRATELQEFDAKDSGLAIS